MHWVRRFVNRYARKKCVEVFEVGRKDCAFVVEEQCASCGLCLEVCPIEDFKDTRRLREG